MDLSSCISVHLKPLRENTAIKQLGFSSFEATRSSHYHWAVGFRLFEATGRLAFQINKVIFKWRISSHAEIISMKSRVSYVIPEKNKRNLQY